MKGFAEPLVCEQGFCNRGLTLELLERMPECPLFTLLSAVFIPNCFKMFDVLPK